VRLYQYDDIKKLNQALGSFKRNTLKVIDVKIITVEGKNQFFVVADPPYDSKPKKKKAEKEKVEKKVEVKEPAKKKTEKK